MMHKTNQNMFGDIMIMPGLGTPIYKFAMFCFFTSLLFEVDLQSGGPDQEVSACMCQSGHC